MKSVNPPKSGPPNESLCDVIKLGISFEKNLVFLQRKPNLTEHKNEYDIALMKNKGPHSV